MALIFSAHFDAVLARSGPGAIFTLTADGELRLHADRTRDAWQRFRDQPLVAASPAAASPAAGSPRVSGSLDHQLCHCLFRDRATGWVQYVLATAPQLCRDHPRADIWHYDTEDAALAVLASLGPARVWRDEQPPAVAP